MDMNKTSKFISLILRHKPEVIGITLDEHGWADVEKLVAGIQRTQAFDCLLYTSPSPRDCS